jgi:hypothetical protein
MWHEYSQEPGMSRLAAFPGCERAAAKPGDSGRYDALVTSAAKPRPRYRRRNRVGSSHSSRRPNRSRAGRAPRAWRLRAPRRGWCWGVDGDQVRTSLVAALGFGDENWTPCNGRGPRAAVNACRLLLYRTSGVGRAIAGTSYAAQIECWPGLTLSGRIWNEQWLDLKAMVVLLYFETCVGFSKEVR